MKKFLCLLLFIGVSLSINAQDFIVLKNNKNVHCTISGIEKCMIFISIDKKAYKIPTADLSGIAVNVGSKKGEKKSMNITKKLNCLNISEIVDNYQLFYNPQVDGDELRLNFSTDNMADNNDIADLVKYRQKGYMIKNTLIAFGLSALGAFGVLLLF
jgi:hypothetical protein